MPFKNPLSIKRLGGKVKKIEPHHLILLGVAVFVIMLSIFSYVREGSTVVSVDYQGKSSSGMDEFKNKKMRDDEAARLGANDPSVRLANRVAEANALTLGLLQYILYKRIVRDESVTGVNDLMKQFSESDLKPPGVSVVINVRQTDFGQIVSPRGAYFIRYQATPLVVEVLSSGKNESDGSVFVVRAPDNSALPVAKDLAVKAAFWATLYVAPGNGDAPIPPAFSDAGAYREKGWTVEPLRVSDISPEKLKEINKYLVPDN